MATTDRATKSAARVAELERIRMMLFDLAPLVQRLRNALQEHLAQHRLRLGEYGSFLGFTWGTVAPLLKGEGVLCGGKAFDLIVGHLKLDDLKQRIPPLAAGLKTDIRRGMAIHPPAVITLAIDLEIAAVQLDLPPMDFAALFVEHAETVAGALRQTKTDLARLGDGDVFAAVRSNLDARDFAQRAGRQREAVLTRQAAKARQLEGYVRELLRQKVAKSRDEVAKRLGVNRSTLGYAVKAAGGEATLDELLANARRLLKLTDPDPVPPAPINPSPSVPAAVRPVPAGPVSPAPVPAPTNAALVAALDNLDQVATGVSPLGVCCVITAASWQTISGNLDSDYQRQLIAAFQRVRALMALQIQNDDQSTRVTLQQDREIGREIDEFLLQLKLWATKHPTILLPVHDQQRISFGIFEAEKGGKRP